MKKKLIKIKIKFIQQITVTDPDSNLPVEVAIYKDEESGGIFGVDSSFLETEETVYSPFNKNSEVDIDGAEEELMNKKQ